MNARQQAKLDSVFGKFNTRGVLAFTFIIFCFSFLFFLLYKTVPEVNRDMVNILSGAMFTQVVPIVKWFFETSKDKADSDKVRHLNELENQVTVTTQKTSTPQENHSSINI